MNYISKNGLVKTTYIKDLIKKDLDAKGFNMDTNDDITMNEVARLLLGLRAAGWTEKEINDFVLYIESVEEQYKPTNKNKKTE